MRKCCDWSNVSEVVCKVSWYCWHFGQFILCCGAVLCIGRCLAAPLASTHWKPIAGDSRHTQNIQISTVIGENEKCVFCFMEKTKQTFWPTQYIPKNLKWETGFSSELRAVQDDWRIKTRRPGSQGQRTDTLHLMLRTLDFIWRAKGCLQRVLRKNVKWPD